MSEGTVTVAPYHAASSGLAESHSRNPVSKNVNTPE